MSAIHQAIIELFNDLEIARTPNEMNEYFYKIFDAVQKSKELKAAARLKKGLFKKFLEEFYPLFCYSQSKYCDKNCKMNIVLGNQGYDAVLLNSDNKNVFFEITSFIDGKKDYKNAEKMNKEGVSYTNYITECVHSKYRNLILKNLEKKSLKNYNNVNLILVIDTTLYFEVIDEDSTDFINELIDDIKNIHLSFNEIFLLHEVGNSKYNIDKYFYKIC